MPDEPSAHLDLEQPAPACEPESVKLTPEQIAESKAYGRHELVCSLADMAIDLIYLGLMAFLGAMVVDQWLGQWAIMDNSWIRLAGIYFVTMGLHYLVSFPLSVYSGFVLEHKFGLSHQRFSRWLTRYLLQNALVLIFGLLLILGLFAIIWWSGRWWWIVAAAASFVVTALLGQFVPVLILPLFYKIEKLDDGELAERFQQLAHGTSLKLEGVYRMKMSSETAKANAMLAGLGHTRRVILGDTLLDEFTADEIAVVLAHEIGHHVYHHITKLMLLGLGYSVVSFFLCDRILVAWVSAQQGSFDYSTLPVVALPMMMFVITVFSLLLSPLRNSLSRRFETACDRHALSITGNHVAFRSAFTKLAKLNKADLDPHPVEVVLFHDHPPIATRLALADEPVAEA